jgi:ketosteroid isomerase-like protein
MAHDVFVSYSSKDKPTADAVCAVLESQGIRCWVAPRDILPGHDWGGSIIEAINGACAMVLIFSANANASPQIKREVERAVNKGIPIIPLRIEDVAPTATLEYFISTPHWLDAFTPPLDRHLQYLAEVVRKIVGGPESESREEAKAEAARAAEEKRKSAEVAEATRLAEEKRKAEEEAKLAEEKRRAAEEAERARVADEKKKAAEVLFQQPMHKAQPAPMVDSPLKRSKAWLFVASTVVLLCLGGVALWYFTTGKELLTLRRHSSAVTDSSGEKTNAQTEPSSEEKAHAETELKELEDKMERWATTARDVSRLASFIADDCVANGNGTTQNKAQLVDNIRNDSDTYKFAANENLDVHLYSRTSAVVTGLSREKGTDKDGKPFDRSYRFTDTWTKRNGQWRLTAHEVRLL